MKRKHCTVKRCTNKHMALGLCNKHYQEHKRRIKGIVPKQVTFDRKKHTKGYFQRTKETRTAQHKAWTQKHRQYANTYAAIWRRSKRLKDPIGAMLSSAKSSAKRRGLDFSLKREELKIPTVCPVLKVPLIYGNSSSDRAASLDRKDNSKGYTKDNVHIISWRANKLKSDATHEEIAALARYVRPQKIVFTSGVFDGPMGLHDGHRYLLNKAKELGDILIVAVNDDSYVERKKNRKALTSLQQRIEAIRQLGIANMIIPLFEDTPQVLIDAFQPNFVVVGNDYEYEQVIGNDVADVVIIERLPGLSTTKLIEDMKAK